MDGILKMHLMGGTWQSLVSLEIYGESVLPHLHHRN
jgi:hypothetical protein